LSYVTLFAVRIPKTVSEKYHWFPGLKAEPESAKRFVTLYSKQNNKKNGYRGIKIALPGGIKRK